MKKNVKGILALLFALVLVLTACGNGDASKSSSSVEGSEGAKSESSAVSEESAAAASSKGLEKLVIGVSPVPHEQIVQQIAEDMKERGYELEVKVFDDYVVPNKALASGDLDANFFQHEPYLTNFCKENKLDLVSIGKIHLEPIGLYAGKAPLKSLDELPEGAEVLIPNDATNGARGLLILQKAGLIKLDDPNNIEATERNIVENPKKLKFTSVEAAVIPNLYKNADLAAINSNYALGAGLNPVKDAVAVEDKDSPYANIVAVRKGEENDEKFKALMECLQSDKIKQYIEKEFNGSIIPSF